MFIAFQTTNIFTHLTEASVSIFYNPMGTRTFQRYCFLPITKKQWFFFSWGNHLRGTLNIINVHRRRIVNVRLNKERTFMLLHKKQLETNIFFTYIIASGLKGYKNVRYSVTAYKDFGFIFLIKTS